MRTLIFFIFILVMPESILTYIQDNTLLEVSTWAVGIGALFIDFFVFLTNYLDNRNPSTVKTRRP